MLGMDECSVPAKEGRERERSREGGRESKGERDAGKKREKKKKRALGHDPTAVVNSLLHPTGSAELHRSFLAPE